MRFGAFFQDRLCGVSGLRRLGAAEFRGLGSFKGSFKGSFRAPLRVLHSLGGLPFRAIRLMLQTGSTRGFHGREDGPGVRTLGFRVLGLGLGFWGLGFRVLNSGGFYDSAYRVWGTLWELGYIDPLNKVPF